MLQGNLAFFFLFFESADGLLYLFCGAGKGDWVGTEGTGADDNGIEGVGIHSKGEIFKGVGVSLFCVMVKTEQRLRGETPLPLDIFECFLFVFVFVWRSERSLADTF